jgi:ABC-2 type transport system ATP-binding protein
VGDDAAAAVRALESMADGEVSAEQDVIRLSVRERRGSIVEAVRRLSEAGVGVEDLAVRRPTLDDVFLTLTGHAAEDAAAANENDGDSA